MNNYIEDVLVDLRKFINELLKTKKYYEEKGYFSSFDYEVKDLNRFKLSLLAVLFTQNFDELILKSDDELKQIILANKPLGRKKSNFSFENGGYFKSDMGVEIKSIPSWIDSSEPSKIFTEIRNAIAHSHYEYDNGVIKNLNAHNNQFESECDLDWLEMMVLCLFSNKRSTYNEGARDIQIDVMIGKFGLGLLLDAYVIEVENDGYDEMNFMQKLILKDNVLAKLVNDMHVKQNYDALEDEEKFFKEVYDSCHLKVINFKKVSDAVLDKIETVDYKCMDLERRAELVKSKIQYYYNKEEKNTIAYKNTLELLNIAKCSRKKQKKKLVDTGAEFMFEPIVEYSIKTYVNFVYNYMLEKLNYDMDGVDIDKINFVKYADSKPLERHIRNACCHDRFIIKEDDVYIYDQSASGNINFEMKCKVKDFIQITDNLVNKLKKQGLLTIDINNILNSNKR